MSEIGAKSSASFSQAIGRKHLYYTAIFGAETGLQRMAHRLFLIRLFTMVIVNQTLQ